MADAAVMTGAGAIRAIVLDFNGTLAEDDHLVAPLYVRTLASAGVEVTADEYFSEFAAMPDEQAFEIALRRAGLPADAERRQALVEARVAGYIAAVAGDPPIGAHAAEFVRAAAARVPLAIASGAFRREIEHVLDASGLSGHFEAVVTIDDVRAGKPDPEGFERALALVNASVAATPPIAPWEVVAVEDATGGAEAARAAGMRVAAIRGPAYDPSSGLADIVIDRLDHGALDQILAIEARPPR